MESAMGEDEAEGTMNGQSDLTSTGQTDGVVEQKHRKKTGQQKRNKKNEKVHIREEEWQRIPLEKSCCAPRFSDLSSRKRLQIQQE